ncbi:MAG: T9SS type A sorting domain-containing protein [Bacteroidetes bacterium]|jgi:hypothetical protein|nr:T9SS type A sorting domain-containing protein [Bacteroidota bacterium]MBT3749911.1 T9SS type A sorting domain-containing protein [Bacteroidota bacterium]MBT4401160.1 T9SS type A sorting domain-containing protein [Bacteroidota bacterium]MBT4411205.1 T9SS type A sorting domain-containing protein [Bacteroidota bacterium]MBT7463736.1 T9SS type A sorting domain-containing protein [Bacteroidota bacterium]
MKKNFTAISFPFSLIALIFSCQIVAQTSFENQTIDDNFNSPARVYLMLNQGKAGFISMPGIVHQFYIPEFTGVMLECIRVIDSIAGSTTSTHQTGFTPNEINVFPNPFNDNLIIQLPENLDGEVNVTISNLTGQILYEKNFNSRLNSGEVLQLDLSGLTISKSVLILQITNEILIFKERLMQN